MNSLRALRPLRSNSIDESEHEARKRAARKSNQRRHLETDLRQPAQPRLCRDGLARDRVHATVCTRGRRYPAGAISAAAVMFGLGPNAL
jgi:hypothetical protein